MKIVGYCSLIVAALIMQSWMAGDKTITKENGMTTINTTTIGKDV